jgi:chromate transporter
MGAVAAGLVVATGLKLLPTLRRNPMGLPLCLLIGAITFGLVGWLRLPMIWVLPGLGSAAIAAAWWRLRR